MRRFTAIIVAILLLSSCGNRHPAPDPVGIWENTTHWGDNKITLTIRPDSVMLFKAERGYCPGQRYFVAVGKWHIENDSVLVMEQLTDSTHFELAEIFPELVQGAKDYNNVTVLGVTAKLILRDSLLYDVTPEGKAAVERNYRRTSKNTMPQ